MDFAVPANHIVQMKESEEINKYLDLVRDLKNLRSKKLTMIAMIVDTLGTVTKDMQKRQAKIGNQRKNPDHTDHGIIVTVS